MVRPPFRPACAAASGHAPKAHGRIACHGSQEAPIWAKGDAADLRRCPASGRGPPEIVRGRIQTRLTASSGGRTGSAPVRDSAPLQRSATANPKIQRYVHEDAHGTAVESGRPEQGVQHVVLGTLIESWVRALENLEALGL